MIKLVVPGLFLLCSLTDMDQPAKTIQNGGASADIIFILLKNSGKKSVLNVKDIETIGKSKLNEAGITELIRLQEH